jgi:hypothetical protein
MRATVRYAFLFALLALPDVFSLRAQQVQLDNFREQFSRDKIFRMNGGLSASTVFYSGNNPTRDPFNRILSGNMNFSLFNQLNLPFNINLNNLGANYSYPTLPNRISIHPAWKWIAGHIGDVSMSFSPYTLGGHQFTGAGIDLTPPGFPLQFSAMYGRMLKATPYDPENPASGTAYKRTGYGAKLRYERDRYAVGMTWFGAGDDPNSLEWKPDSLSVFPQGNQAFSWDATLKMIRNLTFHAEYGVSILTRDTRMPRSGDSFFNKMFDRTESTAVYHALNMNVSYQLFKNVIGISYERIDPGYQTLGAYYFTNDVENVTLNYARPLFGDKVTLAASAGVQRDDLDNSKDSDTKRLVGSVNVNVTPSEKLNFTASYSGFQSYTNIKSQFDYINQMTPYDNLDTLDFTQLSQNAAASVNYLFGKNENRRHSLNFNLSFQEAADKQNDIIRKGNISRFYNFAATYGLSFVPQGIQLTASANATHNTAGFDRTLTCGPMLGVTANLFEKKLNTGISASYNATSGNGTSTGNILNLRWNASYTFRKKHVLSVVLINQRREAKNRGASKDFTATCGYSYRF